AFSKKRRTARGRRGRRRWCSSTARPRARARRRTRRGSRLRLELERGRRGFVHQEPTLRLQEIAARGVRESADAVGGDDAMTRNDEWQAVVAAALPDVTRIGAELAGRVAIGARLAARD